MHRLFYGLLDVRKIFAKSDKKFGLRENYGAVLSGGTVFTYVAKVKRSGEIFLFLMPGTQCVTIMVSSSFKTPPPPPLRIPTLHSPTRKRSKFPSIISSSSVGRAFLWSFIHFYYFFSGTGLSLHMQILKSTPII